MAMPKILDLSPLQDFLGIRSPEPPAGLRASIESGCVVFFFWEGRVIQDLEWTISSI